jgi:hypothetical protein
VMTLCFFDINLSLKQIDDNGEYLAPVKKIVQDIMGKC